MLATPVPLRSAPVPSTMTELRCRLCSRLPAMFLGVEYKDVLRHVAGHELTLGGLTNYREAYIAQLSSSAKAYLPAGLASVIGLQ